MKETSISSTAGAQPANLISANAPRRTFIAHFQRWEWMLVALVVIAIVINSRLTPYFLNAAESYPVPQRTSWSLA